MLAIGAAFVGGAAGISWGERMAWRAGGIERVGVTGAAGFIGSHLCQRLISEGIEVIGVDDLSHGELANLESCRDHPLFTIRTVDCCCVADLHASFRRCDAVVHLAARKIPRYGGADETLRRNVASVESACSVALDIGAVLILISSSEVYGNAPLPLTEDSWLVLGPPTTQRWAYAASKLYGEHLVLALAAERGLSATILRLFGSYGPHNHRSWWGGPQSAFVEALLDGEPMEIHGDGQQIRSFTYVSDTVEGIVRALRFEPARGEVINIGRKEPIRIVELASLVQGTLGIPPPLRARFISYNDLPGAYQDVRIRIPDTRKAKALLDFEASTPLAVGIEETIDWHRHRRAAAEPSLAPTAR
jgi:UDP-glucose 4-epimerase